MPIFLIYILKCYPITLLRGFLVLILLDCFFSLEWFGWPSSKCYSFPEKSLLDSFLTSIYHFSNLVLPMKNSIPTPLPEIGYYRLLSAVTFFYDPVWQLKMIDTLRVGYSRSSTHRTGCDHFVRNAPFQLPFTQP